MSKRNVRLRAFARLNKNGDVVPSSLVMRARMPKSGGTWVELTANHCCTINWSTTTSTTTTTTTTT